jgi:predicted RND superfamily exporter protein
MMGRFFHAIGHLCLTRPWWVIACFGMLTLGAVPLVLQLPVEADLRQTLPRDLAQSLERRLRLFGRTDMVFVLVEARSERRVDLIAFGQALADRLASSALIERVEFGYPPAMMQRLQALALDYAPLFVAPGQLATFERLLTPQGIRTQIRKTLLELHAVGPGVRDRLLLDDPLQLRRFALARFAALRGSFRFDVTSPYFLSPDGTALLIRIEGRAAVDDMAGAKATVALLRQAWQQLLALPAFQGLTVQGTGGYFLAVESERVVRSDIIRSLVLAVGLICGLVAWTFRRWVGIVYSQLPTLVGLFLALGMFALLRPRLNALSLGCAAALVGLGIDFAIHILTQCFDELGRGRALRQTIQTAIRETGGSLMAAAATTMAAFAAFLFSDQPFLQDMGLLAVLGILGCLLLSMVLLPALIVCFPDQHRRVRPRSLGVPWFIGWVLRYPRVVLGVSLALSVAATAVIVWRPPAYETDLRNIHAANSPALRVQQRIATLFGGSQEPLMLFLEAPTEEQVLRDMQRLHPSLHDMIATGTLAAVTSPGLFVPNLQHQEAVLQVLRHKDPAALTHVLTAALADSGFDMVMVQGYVRRVRQALSRREPLQVAQLEALGFTEMLGEFLGRDNTGAVGLMLLFPKQELWTAAARQTVVQRVNAALAAHGLHGTLTGLYTVSSESAARIAADFRRVTLLALVAVVLIVVLRFRRLRTVGLVILPVGCGALWTAGLFAVWGLKLNMMNIAILPMILGIGIDDGIHIVHRFQTHGARNVREALRFTGTAVCLSSLTTMLAFGTLALSTNRGIASVGLLSLVGMAASLLASLGPLPAALEVWEEHA